MIFLYKIARFIYRLFGISGNQVFHKKISTVFDKEEGNRMIYNAIVDAKPFMISRFGTPESSCIINSIEINALNSSSIIKRIDAKCRGYKDDWDENMKQSLTELVGFFPTDNINLKKFADYYTTQIMKVDAIGIWGFVYGEKYIIDKFCKIAIKYNPISLESYFFKNPWTKSLEGKKVLVIHPFEASIKNQYQKRPFLFSDKNVLPSFELKTIKAVQTIAGNRTNFTTWFEALDFMKFQIDDCDFDVALIGAGSYGLPLSAYIKSKGKVAVHIGGSLQILFGIKGKRWDDHEMISKMYNEYWVRPSIEEVVPDANKVEGGCYW